MGTCIINRAIKLDTYPGVKQINYIKSDGSCYIDVDCGFVSGQALVVEAKLEFTQIDTSRNNVIIGCNGSSNRQWLYLSCSSSKKWYITYLSHTYSSSSTISVDTPYTIEWTSSSSLVQVVVNGNQEIYVTSPTTSTPTDRPMYMFASQYDYKPSEWSNIKLYYLNIKRGGTYIRKYIPVKHLYDGAYGLYDTINNFYRGNQGSGTFTNS